MTIKKYEVIGSQAAGSGPTSEPKGINSCTQVRVTLH